MKSTFIGLLCLAMVMLCSLRAEAGGSIITAISPHAGPAGTIVSVSGAGLGNVTSAAWNGYPVTVLTVADNLVRCEIPSGTGSSSISLTGGGLTTFSPDSFMETSSRIRLVKNIDSAKTERIAIGDVDGDGVGDVLKTIVFDYHGIQARCVVSDLSSNSGIPRTPVITTLGEADSIPASIASISISRNGMVKQGLVVLSHDPGTGRNGADNSYTLSVLLPDSGVPGGFTQGARYKLFSVTAEVQPAGRVAVGDLNGDGAPDIVCSTHRDSGDSLVVFLNDAAGHGDFAPGIAIDESGVHITDFCLASMSMPPSHLDILVATSTGVDLLSNSGNGLNYTRFPGKYLVTGTSRLLTGDVDGDGVSDVVCLSKSAGTITVTFRDVAGNAAASAVYTSPLGLSNEIALGDFTGDNVPEIAIDEPGVQRSISFLTWSGGGSGGAATFKKIVIHEECDDGNDRAFAVGDIDNDGIADCGVGACQSSITVLPKIVSFSPSVGPAGTLVTVTGQNLNLVTSVTLDGVSCPIIDQSGSAITLNARSSGHAGEKIEFVVETLGRVRTLQTFTGLPNGTVALSHLDSSVVKQVISADVDGDGISDALEVIEYRDADDGPGHMRHRALASRLSTTNQVKLVTVRLADAEASDDPLTVATGDVTGDGRADIVVFNRGPRQTTSLDGSFSPDADRNMITIFKSDSTNPGSFERQDQWPKASGITAVDIQVVDLDHDGLNDIVFACSDGTTDSIFVWNNDPAHPGTFSEYKVQSGFIYATQAPSAPKLAPYSPPGVPGASIALNAAHGIVVLSRSSNSDPYAPTGTYNPSTRYSWVGMGDFTGDGIPDLACVQTDSSYIDVIGGSALGFAATQTTKRCEGCGNPWLGRTAAVSATDLDKDGIMDLVVCVPGSSNAFTIFKGGVTGLEPISVKEDCDDTGDRLVATGDVNGDGYPDVIVSSCTTTMIYPPLVSSTIPLSGPLGTSIRLKGRNLEALSSARFVDNSLSFSHPDASSLALSTSNVKVTKSGDTMTGPLLLDASPSMECAAGPFSLTPNYLVSLPHVDSSSQRDVYIADVDGDGHADAIECIVVSSSDGPSLLVTTSLGNGDGTFQQGKSATLSPRLRIGTVPSAAHVIIMPGDVDGDGRADLVVVSNLEDASSSNLEVFKCTSTGSGVFDPSKWQLRSKKGLNAVNVKLAVADMDGDGLDDIVLATPNGGAGVPSAPDSIAIYFSSKQDSGTRGPVKWMAPEVLRKVHAVHRGYGARASLYGLGDSIVVEFDSIGVGPTYDAVAHVGNGHHIDDFVVADLDGDGLLDIATHSLDSGSINLYLKTYNPTKQYVPGDATIYNESLYHAGRLLTGDLDDDGTAEVEYTPSNGGPVCVARTVPKTKGDYLPAHNFKMEIDGRVPAGGITVAAGDVNGDGYADFVVSPTGGSAPPASSLTASVSALDFGEVIVGDSVTRSFELTNRGGKTPRQLITIVGGPNARCAVISPAPDSLPPGATAQITVRFKPTRTDAPFTDTLTIASLETNFAILLTGSSTDTASYRSFSVDSIVTSVNEAGKPMTSVKPKPNTVHFTVQVSAPSDSLDGLVLQFSQSINLSKPRLITHTGYLLGGDDLPADSKAKSVRITLQPTKSGDVVTYTAWGTKGALMKVSGYYWTKGAVMSGKKLKNPTMSLNELGLPMPNRINEFEDLFSNGGFASSGGALVIGQVKSDSSKQYGWLAAKKSKDVLKSFFEKGDKPTQDQFRPFDTYSNGSPIIKGLSALPLSKFDSRLFVELITLKVNIAASDAGNTPPGFGDLVFDDSTDNELNGYSLRSISSIGDSMMMGHYDANTRQRINELEAKLRNLGMIVGRINNAFEGPLDTARFGAGLKWTACRSLAEVSYVHRTEDGSSKPISVSRGTGYVPLQYALNQNYPNPFNPTTTISYTLAQSSLVTLKVYNILGQQVAMIADKVGMEEGEHEARFDAGRLASGVYFYRLTAQPLNDDGISVGALFSKVGKMMLVK